jgi:hypothetical protein
LDALHNAAVDSHPYNVELMAMDMEDQDGLVIGACD